MTGTFDRIRELHRPDDSTEYSLRYCRECGGDLPCTTLEILEEHMSRKAFRQERIDVIHRAICEASPEECEEDGGLCIKAVEAMEVAGND